MTPAEALAALRGVADGTHCRDCGRREAGDADYERHDEEFGVWLSCPKACWCESMCWERGGLCVTSDHEWLLPAIADALDEADGKVVAEVIRRFK